MAAALRGCCCVLVLRGRFMFPAVQGVVQIRGRAISCWSALTVFTAWCATEPPRIAPPAIFPSPILPPIPAKSSMRSEVEGMTELRSYVRDGAEIYRNSFAIIRAEANLSRFEQN